jgi:hypothetical protein
LLHKFSDVNETVQFDGATELLELARREKVYSLRLRFIESYISREGRTCVVLASLPDYFAFMSDESGELRRYLFESNVRDYLGQVRVNEDIMSTLSRNAPPGRRRFLVAKQRSYDSCDSRDRGWKEISLENVQIVNGL